MSKNINLYLPEVLQPILEFKVSNESLDIELDDIDNIIENITKEVAVETASEYGISRWEKSLGITPNKDNNLETRRFVLYNTINDKLPYTVSWLKNKLSQIVGGESAFILNIDSENYQIIITLSGLDLKIMHEIEKQLRTLIPANMSLALSGGNIVLSGVYWATGMRLGYKVLIGSNYDLL